MLQRRSNSRTYPKELLMKFKNEAYAKMLWGQKRGYPLYERENRERFEHYRRELLKLGEVD